MFIKRIFYIFIIFLLFLSCGNEKSSSSNLSVEEIFNLAKDQITTSQSFSFALAHKEGFTALPGNYNISKAEGDIEKPNKILIKSEIISNNLLLKLSYLSINEKYWITNPISFDWIETPSEDNPFKNINPINIVSDIFFEIENASIKSVNKNIYEIKAEINSNNLKSLVGEIIIPNTKVNLSIFIKEDGLVKKILIYGKVQPNDTNLTIREIKFENWNEKLIWQEP